MVTSEDPMIGRSSRRTASLALFLCALVALSGCDRMKQFIDPSGTGYRKDDAPVASSPNKSNPPPPASNPSSPTPPPPAPVPVARGANDAVIREKATGRFLTRSDIDSQLARIDFTADRRTFRLVRGIHRDRSGITTVRDSAGRYWGEAIGDLNMDGSDDAVLLLRTDKPGGAVVWDLAYLPNREGRLHNVQTVRLPGDLGFGDVVIEGSGILLTPVQDGPNVHLGYIGGELSLTEN